MEAKLYSADGRLTFFSKPNAALAVTTLLLAAVDLGWGLAGEWSIAGHGVALHLLGALGLLSPLLFERYRRDEKIRIALTCSSLFILFAMTACFFGYLLVSTNAPLVDNTLAAWDRALGFDWPRVYLWTKHRPQLSHALALAYSSAFPQIAVVIIYLSFTKRQEQLAEFNAAMIFSYLITSVVSVYFPAAGPAKFYQEVVHADVSLLSHFEPLRDGTLRIFDLRSAQGLVSIPSFHTIMAILLAYAMRRTRIFPIFLILNIAVILSTPTQGSHYLVDLIAGAATAMTAIALLRNRSLLSLRLSLERDNLMPPHG
ncbi:PAP2 family protein [Caballeronia hypogeia]|uniref:PAP2 family protein n=1 Tax=Caballeronia hypogeia TaxID=1777140 RepID=A0A158BXK5_9BURK|nr:phosphatase PAP2 family protein [Caballeronia hypogeia]SAK74386.1 PAP2 family protein [Caballeronia hypogeia]